MRRRARAAKRNLAQRFEALGACIFVTVNVHDLAVLADLAASPANLYRKRAVQRIREYTKKRVTGSFFLKLEWTLGIGLHLHFVVWSLEQLLPLVGGDVAKLRRAKNVGDIRGLLAYLSKPPDARATKLKAHQRPWTPEEIAAARELYQAARDALTKRSGKGSRLPACAWHRLED